MADIAQITLPSGTTYDIKDAEARALIAALEGFTKFLGVTTTALTDGDSTNPVTINGQSVTAQSGDIVTYGSEEFIFNGSVWQSFGDLSGLGALAFKDNASGSFTPAGTVSQPTFTGTSSTFTGTSTPSGTVTISKAATPSPSEMNYTPEGSVTLSGGGSMASTDTIAPVSSVGTLPALTATVANENLTLAWDAGTLPTLGTDKAFVTEVTSYTPTATFAGTSVKLEGTFAGTAETVTVTGTPDGTVSQPTFTGTADTVTVS